MKPFTICIIAKNEENCIERCLKSIQDFDCEILVVDTGSTDMPPMTGYLSWIVTNGYKVQNRKDLWSWHACILPMWED